MIETREALEALDDILGVDGIDGVFVGPADLSIALSNGARWEPRGPAVLEAAGQVVARARAHGKFAGMFCYDGADAARDGRARLQTVLGRVGRLAPARRREGRTCAARGRRAPGSGKGAKSY